MQIDLSQKETDVLRAALERHIEELMSELAATESRSCQHELARTVDDLEAIAQKLKRPA